MPATEEVEQQLADKEVLFNWDKLKEEKLPPLDDEVVFDRSKKNEVDKQD